MLINQERFRFRPQNFLAGSHRPVPSAQTAAQEGGQLEENPQADLFAAMARPDFYPHPVKAVEKRETHISCVFLTGSRVYKVKKAVDLGFLDFTSLERRRHFCGQELHLNRRLSEGVYLDVVAIRRLGSGFSLGEAGEVVEYAVCMHQLSDAATLGQRLRAGTLGRGVCERLAERLAVFYREAPTGGGIDRFGSREMVGANCEENFTQILPFVPEVLDPRQFQIVRRPPAPFSAGGWRSSSGGCKPAGSATATAICARTTSTWSMVRSRCWTASNSTTASATGTRPPIWPFWPWTSTPRGFRPGPGT